MLPLAIILKGLGFTVSGSDRSYDQGRTPEKFRWLEEQGIKLYPQDGSGITSDISTVVISKAVEDTIPDIAAAKAKNIPILKRVDALTDFFNLAKTRIAVSGTSGKTTTTGMIGFLLRETGMDPTVMNGGIFRNYIADNPYSTAFVGNGDVFVTEVDESDGKDAVCGYEPDIAVIHNITLDHQPMTELKEMFSGFLAKTGTAVLNADDSGVLAIASGFKRKIVTYSTNGAVADIMAGEITPHADGVRAVVMHGGEETILNLAVPGRHNVSNALAALAVGLEMGLGLEQAADTLSLFEGIRRRMEIVGRKNGVTVMDDFAHNPDKIVATLSTLKQSEGRLHIFFQPHGYGFLKIVGPELAPAFAKYLSKEDMLYMVEPFYAGGTVDRSLGSAPIIEELVQSGFKAALMDGRAQAAQAILKNIRAGDRVIIMGARDDTLSDFAAEILELLP